MTGPWSEEMLGPVVPGLVGARDAQCEAGDPNFIIPIEFNSAAEGNPLTADERSLIEKHMLTPWTTSVARFFRGAAGLTQPAARVRSGTTTPAAIRLVATLGFGDPLPADEDDFISAFTGLVLWGKAWAVSKVELAPYTFTLFEKTAWADGLARQSMTADVLLVPADSLGTVGGDNP